MSGDPLEGRTRADAAPRSPLSSVVRWAAVIVLAMTALGLVAVLGLAVWWFRYASFSSSRTFWFLRPRRVATADSDPRLTREYFASLVPGKTTREEVERIIGPSPSPYADGRVYLAPYSRSRAWKHHDYFLGLFPDSRRDATLTKADYWELGYVDGVLVGVTINWASPSSPLVRAVQQATARREARFTVFRRDPAPGHSVGERLDVLQPGAPVTRLVEVLGHPRCIFAREALEVWVYCEPEIRWAPDAKCYRSGFYSAGFCCYLSHGVLIRHPLELEEESANLSEFDDWNSWPRVYLH